MLETTRQNFCNYLVLQTVLMDYLGKTLQPWVLSSSVATWTRYRTYFKDHLRTQRFGKSQWPCDGRRVKI